MHKSRAAGSGEGLRAGVPAHDVAERVPGAPVFRRAQHERADRDRQSEAEADRFSSSGHASTQHLAGELLNTLTGTQLVHIPYKGGGPALLDLLAGRVPVMVSTLPAAVPQIKAGKVRALAVTSTKRSAAVPDLPTVAEAAGLPGYEASTWQGFVFPASTPRAIVQRVADDTSKVVSAPDVRERLREFGYEPVGSTPAEFGAYIKAELVKWTRVIKGAGIKGE